MFCSGPSFLRNKKNLHTHSCLIKSTKATADVKPLKSTLTRSVDWPNFWTVKMVKLVRFTGYLFMFIFSVEELFRWSSLKWIYSDKVLLFLLVLFDYLLLYVVSKTLRILFSSCQFLMWSSIFFCESNFWNQLWQAVWIDLIFEPLKW